MLNYEQKIMYLARRRFPDYMRLIRPGCSMDRSRALKAYEAKLREKPVEEIEALVTKALDEERNAEQLQARLKEERMYFNQPAANADFAHWSKAAHWHLDEAVALSFGKEPSVVRWDDVKKYTQVSPFAKRFERVRDLVWRAQVDFQLPNPIPPGEFLEWAKVHDIDYPPELEELVLRYGGAAVDRRKQFEDESARQEQAMERMRSELEERDQRISEQEIAQSRLLERIAELESAQKERPLTGKERDSALKLIIGMAVEGYRFDPNAARNAATQEITDDLLRSGVSLDADTVRKWLREAAELLPSIRSRNGDR